MLKWALYSALVALFVLHNDIWLWHDGALFLGLPIGLSYHILLCVAASVVMFLLVKFAWPEQLDGHQPEDDSQ